MIAVYGGSFNPPTVAHYEVIKHLLKQPFVDEVMLMPVGDHYNKPDMVAADHRFNMLKKMVKNLPNTTVSDVELAAPNALKTVETLEILQKLHPKEEFAFVMGADNLRDLPKWSQHERLIQEFKMIIFSRGNQDVRAFIQENFPNQADNFIIITDFTPLDISATQYRDNPTNIGLILPVVAEYIKEHGLYDYFSS